MKKKILTIIKAILFIIILFGVLKLLSYVFIPDNYQEIKTVRGFYDEPKNSLDIVFLGDSAMYRGISPMVLWQNHGIASYVFATSSERIWTTYYTLQETLKYQRPKLIVLNTEGVYMNTPQVEEFLRLSMDNKKDDIVKFKTVTDPIYENDLFDVISYGLPILRFHDRWQSLTKKDITKLNSDPHYYAKGYGMINIIKPNKKGFAYYDEGKDLVPIKKTNLEYLNKIVDLCKKENIPLLCITIPNSHNWSYGRHNAFTNYAKEKDIPYIDLNVYAKEYGLDWNKDTCDGGIHLNLSGAEKLTTFVGKYIVNNYEFTNHTKEEAYKEWNEDLTKYNEAKVELVNKKVEKEIELERKAK